MKDLEIKRSIVKAKIDKTYRRYKWQLHKGNYLEADKLEKELAPLFNDKEIDRVMYNLNKSRYYRLEKVHDFISKNITARMDLEAQKLAYFATFTFNNKILESTTEDARRQRIRRLIKSYTLAAVCNIDFGRTTEREHYHAIILADKEQAQQMQKKAEKNGFVSLFPIRTTKQDITRLTKYINKLSYHAIKDTEQHFAGAYRCFYYNSFD